MSQRSHRHFTPHCRPRRIDFHSINQAAIKQSHKLLAELLPGGVARGNEYVVLNPRRKDMRPGSFSINIRTGRWGDFAIGAYGGDFISLAAYVLDIEPRQAAELVGYVVGVAESVSVDNWRLIR
jgi:putative DNA primase/helicase